MFVQMRDPALIPRGDNYEIAKIHCGNYKIFSRMTESISPKLGTMHPSVKGIQFVQMRNQYILIKLIMVFFLLLNNVTI